MQREQRNQPSRRIQAFSSDFGMSDPASHWGASPRQMMRHMQEDMERMFGQYPPMPASQTAARMGMPSMNLSETDAAMQVMMDLPGFTQDDISVEMHDNRLIVSAETRNHDRYAPEHTQNHRRERQYGRYERMLMLPQNVDAEQITAQFADGVLSIEVPKTERTLTTGRRIAVTGASPNEIKTTSRAPRSSDHQAVHGETQGGPSLAGLADFGFQDQVSA